MSFPGVLVFATAFYGNLLVDYIATIGAIPHWHIGPAVVTVGTSIRWHFTVYPLRLLYLERGIFSRLPIHAPFLTPLG